MNPLLLAVVPIVVTGLVTAALRLLNTKAEHARQEVDKSAVAVNTIKTAMEGLALQAENLRKDYDRSQERGAELARQLEVERGARLNAERALEECRDERRGGTGSA